MKASKDIRSNKIIQEMCIEERIETYEGGYPYSEAFFSQEEGLEDFTFYWRKQNEPMY